MYMPVFLFGLALLCFIIVYVVTCKPAEKLVVYHDNVAITNNGYIPSDVTNSCVVVEIAGVRNFRVLEPSIISVNYKKSDRINITLQVPSTEEFTRCEIKSNYGTVIFNAYPYRHVVTDSNNALTNSVPVNLDNPVVLAIRDVVSQETVTSLQSSDFTVTGPGVLENSSDYYINLVDGTTLTFNNDLTGVEYITYCNLSIDIKSLTEKTTVNSISLVFGAKYEAVFSESANHFDLSVADGYLPIGGVLPYKHWASELTLQTVDVFDSVTKTHKLSNFQVYNYPTVTIDSALTDDDKVVHQHITLSLTQVAQDIAQYVEIQGCSHITWSYTADESITLHCELIDSTAEMAITMFDKTLFTVEGSGDNYVLQVTPGAPTLITSINTFDDTHYFLDETNIISTGGGTIQLEYNSEDKVTMLTLNEDNGYFTDVEINWQGLGPVSVPSFESVSELGYENELYSLKTTISDYYGAPSSITGIKFNNVDVASPSTSATEFTIPDISSELPFTLIYVYKNQTMNITIE